jgi:hypothetical protein
MVAYRHVKSGQTVEVQEGSSATKIYENSPSWRRVSQETREDTPGPGASAIDRLGKDQILGLLRERQQQASVHETKKELAEKLQSKSNAGQEAVGFKFTDNLV